LRLAAAAVLLAAAVPSAALAAPQRSDLTHEIISFFGFGPDQAKIPPIPCP